MAFLSGPYRIETPNAVYSITFGDREITDRPRYDLIDERILQNNPDALMVEFAGARPHHHIIDLLVANSKTKPPVFLVDVFSSKRQVEYAYSKQNWGLLVKTIGVGAATALLIRKAYLAKKKRSPMLQEVQSKAGIAFFDKWYWSRKVQNFLRRFRKKELEMNPARRKFLKIGAFALLGLLSEGIDPIVGRATPGVRGISERIDLLWKNFTVTGRNALIAERLESFVAPRVTHGNGKKPEISVVMGNGHKGIMAQLTNPTLRRKTLQTFRQELLELPDGSKQIGVYRYDSVTRKYVQGFEPDPMLVRKKVGFRESRRAPRKRIEDVRMSRRTAMFGWRKRRPQRRA